MTMVDIIKFKDDAKKTRNFGWSKVPANLKFKEFKKILGVLFLIKNFDF